MYLLGQFSFTALVLASVGIFGVLSYNVRQRLREIGVRMALGTRPDEVLRMVIGDGFKLTLTLIGLVIGLVGASGILVHQPVAEQPAFRSQPSRSLDVHPGGLAAGRDCPAGLLPVGPSGGTAGSEPSAASGVGESVSRQDAKSVGPLQSLFTGKMPVSLSGWKPVFSELSPSLSPEPRVTQASLPVSLGLGPRRNLRPSRIAPGIR